MILMFPQTDLFSIFAFLFLFCLHFGHFTAGEGREKKAKQGDKIHVNYSHPLMLEPFREVLGAPGTYE